MESTDDELVGGSRLHSIDQYWDADETNRAYATEVTNNGRAFLHMLREANVGVYLEFMDIMQTYKRKSISVSELVEKVEALLKDCPDLFMAFKNFIPEGYQVQRIQNMPEDLNQALIFVKKIKQATDKDLYKRFLNILKKGSQSPENVCSQLTDLWKNHPDLLEEFVCFLPKNPSNRCAPQVKTPLVKQIQMRETKSELVGYKSCLEKCNHHPPSAKSNGRKHERHAYGVESQNRQLLLAQKFAEGNGSPIKQRGKIPIISEDELQKEQTHIQNRNVGVPIVNFLKKNVGFLRLVESNLKEKFEEYLICLGMHSEGFTNHQDLYLQVADMFSKSPELIDGTMDLVRQCETAELELIQGNGSYGCKKRPWGDKGEREAMMKQRKKSKIQPSCALNANLEQENYFNKPCLPSQKTPCTMGLEASYSNCGFSCPENMLQNNGNTSPFKESSPNKISHTTNNECMEGEHNKRHPFTKNPHNKSFPSYNATGHKSMEQENSNRHPVEENSHNKYFHVASSKSLIQDSSKKNPFKEDPHSNFSLAIDNEYLDKPLSDLDLAKCEQCTPSYRRLPNDYPLPTVGSRSMLEQAVLNDTWVSVRSGREDYSFDCMRKNKYEEVLLNCEDDRTELDLLIENARTTIRGLEDMLKITRKKQGMFIVEEHITARQLRFIEHLYGDVGLEVLECLHLNPGSVTPIILQRVKQKKDEWTVYKAEMNNLWARVLVKNYDKSLDRCSIYNNDQNMTNMDTNCNSSFISFS